MFGVDQAYDQAMKNLGQSLAASFRSIQRSGSTAGCEVHGVIQGLRKLWTRRGLSGERLKSLNKICCYLKTNADRMR